MKISAEFIQECLNHNRKTQHEFYDLCYPVLIEVCRRYVKNLDDANGILNHGFLKILKNLDKYKENVPFEAWIGRIMINTIIDDFRRNKNYLESHDQIGDLQDLENLNENYELDLSDAQKKFNTEDILTFINALPEMSKKVFNLFAIDGFRHKEIAEILDIQEGSSRWHVSNARKQIIERMQQHIKNS
ncbi:MAG: RNA polymerase sigma factor (sigma-70 family) [Sphingobacteriales bacterium]|jgi:RNA polymerase sigma factor (sigma-70 family)